jgi:hypothetical protein
MKKMKAGGDFANEGQEKTNGASFLKSGHELPMNKTKYASGGAMPEPHMESHGHKMAMSNGCSHQMCRGGSCRMAGGGAWSPSNSSEKSIKTGRYDREK